MAFRNNSHWLYGLFTMHYSYKLVLMIIFDFLLVETCWWSARLVQTLTPSSSWPFTLQVCQFIQWTHLSRQPSLTDFDLPWDLPELKATKLHCTLMWAANFLFLFESSFKQPDSYASDMCGTDMCWQWRPFLFFLKRCN